MDTFKSFEEELYKVNDTTFNDFALRLFRVQAENNLVYKCYLEALGRDLRKIEQLNQIPFLPISFFKTHTVKTGRWKEEKFFTSSGTTGTQTSLHAVYDSQFYLRNAERVFAQFFGDLREYHFLALLPSYLEREGSSLVDMAEYFINRSESSFSGFYLNNWEVLVKNLETLRKDNRKVLLLGVTFALLELAERVKMDLSHCMVMETGGMKGRRREITRTEVHEFLKSRLNLNVVYSEYGMTELLSQAYSMGDGVYKYPPWMKILLRDPEDPFDLGIDRQAGAINIVDLANFRTCAFIETQDLGKMNQIGYFEVLGRIDNSDVRGCNLLVG